MLKSNNIKKGFTIIEVIIVLVIAAIIMVMVFLVVPQLQQSQRNAKRQNTARQVLAAVAQAYANGINADGLTEVITTGALVNSITSQLGTDANKDPGSGSAYSYSIYNSTNSTTPSKNQGNITVYLLNTQCSGQGVTTKAGGGTAVAIAIEPFSSNTYCVAN